MKIIEVVENGKMIVGTSCANCDFTAEQESQKVREGELNSNGGMATTTKKELAAQKEADVITMPGKKSPTTKHWCSNPTVDQWVTERMCCNLWEAPGIIFSCKKDNT